MAWRRAHQIWGRRRLAAADAPFGRVARGAAWLGSGQLIGDAMSVAYLYIFSRALGGDGFNAFVLLVAIGQTVAHFFGLQSWRCVVRFGRAAQAVPDGLTRLCRWIALRDGAVAAAGALCCSAIVWQFADRLGVPPTLRAPACLFSLTILLMQRGVPCGILRLKQRFAVAAAVDAILPVARLVLSAVILLTDGTIETALLGWALAEALATAALWACIALTGGQAVGTAEAQPTIDALRHFYWRSGLSEALRLSGPDIPVLAITMGGGGAALGTYRLASAVAKATSKPVLSLSIAFYTEMMRPEVSGVKATLRAMQQRVIIAAILLSIASLSLCWLFSPAVLPGGSALLTIGLWAAMAISSLATVLEARLLMRSAPLIAPASRIVSVVLSFALATWLARYDGALAGAVAAATAGAVHAIILVLWLNRAALRRAADAAGPGNPAIHRAYSA